MKGAIEGVRVDQFNIPTPKPVFGAGIIPDFTRIEKFWRVELLMFGRWCPATNYTSNQKETEVAYKHIMQELKGENEK